MRYPATIAALLAASFPLSGCGYSVFDATEDMQGNGFENGETISTTAKSTESFTKIEASGPDDIVLATGDEFSIKAEGNAEAIKTLRFMVKRDAIQIGRKNGRWYGDSGKGVTITITAPQISGVSLAGSGNFKGDQLSGDKVAIALAGSGNVDVADVQSPSVKGNVAGSGDMKIAGKVDMAKWSIAGSGDIDASGLASQSADVSVAGSGNVKVTATGTVDASIAGSGDVNVTGGAKCTKSIIGSGSLNCG